MSNQRLNNTPDLADALDVHKREIFMDMNCHAIGTVQSFDPESQTVRATINYKQAFEGVDADGKTQDEYLDYPLLLDVPVVVMSGGQANLTMPNAQGDECLILFNDRDIDNWFQGGGVTKLSSFRLHSFSDGIALIGVHSLAKSVKNYDGTRAVLRNGNASVGVGLEKIQIKNETKNLATILQTLLTALAAGTTVNTVPGSPAAFGLVLVAAINQAVTDLGGLLE